MSTPSAWPSSAWRAVQVVFMAQPVAGLGAVPSWAWYGSGRRRDLPGGSMSTTQHLQVHLKSTWTATQAVDGWRRLAQGKLASLDEQIAKAQTAKEAIAHALHCPDDDIATCPNVTDVIAARPRRSALGGSPPTPISPRIAWWRNQA
jgi:hypothetical protein